MWLQLVSPAEHLRRSPQDPHQGEHRESKGAGVRFHISFMAVRTPQDAHCTWRGLTPAALPWDLVGVRPQFSIRVCITSPVVWLLIPVQRCGMERGLAM